MTDFDLIIVGAGPVGLYATFYAGMRGLSVAMIEAAEVAGGQPQNLYPEKLIYDVAGFPAVAAGDLVKNLLAQAEHVPHELFLSESVHKIEQTADGFSVSTDKGSRTAKAVLLTTGAGLLSPRKLNLEDEEAFYEAGKVAYFVKSLEDFRGQKVAVLGGGDSAVDWALMLEQVADEVHLIHRRDKFRAHELTVAQLEQSSVNVHTPYLPSALTEAGLRLQKAKTDDFHDLQVDKILVNYGFLTNPIQLMEGLALSHSGHVSTNRQMCSNIAGIYAAGDVADYPGKVPLMSVGFGEAVTAINDMTKSIVLDHAVRKGHSSSLFEK